ncbi:MAG: transcriptional regulator, LacI family, partial [Devosia sp.]|nr:transcriptional regulator, LacI family [Devosia sp.]
MSDTDDTESGRRRHATIVEVADRAGVAIGTVSRYLNGHPVRRGNREQIEQAIGELGYRRNAIAAAMKADLTNTVGFMVPSLSEFHAPVLEHLSRSMRRAGRALLSYCHDANPASIGDALDFFVAHRVDCLIMDGRNDVDERILDLIGNGTPVIFYDNGWPGLPVDRV